MIKVIDISSTDRGAYRLLKNRVKAINTYDGFSNSIICPDGQWRKRIEEDGVKTIPYSFTRGLNIIKIINETKTLVDILRIENPNIIHTHNSKSGAIGRISGAIYNFNNKNKVKIIHQVHGYHFTLCTGIKKYIYILIEKWLAAFTDILLFQNMYEYNLAKQYNMDKKTKLKYIGNGIDLSEIKNATSNAKVQGRAGSLGIEYVTSSLKVYNEASNLEEGFIDSDFENDKKINRFKNESVAISCKSGIGESSLKDETLEDKFKNEKEKVLLVCVARIEKVKNHMMLMRGIKELKDKYGVKNVRLICIGEGEEEELRYLKSYINNNRLDENVEFIGICKKEEVLTLVKKSKLMVLTSKKEGKPRAIMEAMALGIPCVGTNVVGTNETIISNKTGLLVQLDDYRELAERINELLKNEELYNRFSKEAIDFANNEFNEEKIIEKIVNIYEEVRSKRA